MAIHSSYIYSNHTPPEYVKFDPLNSQHLEAFRLLCLGENGPTSPLKQHPTLRFKIEFPFKDVRSMMIYKVGMAHIKSVTHA